MRLLAMLLLLVGCGSAGTSDAADLAIGDHQLGQAAPDLDVEHDLTQEMPDLAGVDQSQAAADLAEQPDLIANNDLTALPDLTPAPDLLVYACPGGGTGLPMGAGCANNPQCCTGLCDKTNASGAGLQCCQMFGTNCTSATICCAKNNGATVLGACGLNGLCQ